MYVCFQYPRRKTRTLAGFHSNVLFRRIRVLLVAALSRRWFGPYHRFEQFSEYGVERVGFLQKENDSTREHRRSLNAAQTDAGLIRHTQFRRAGCASWE